MGNNLNKKKFNCDICGFKIHKYFESKKIYKCDNCKIVALFHDVRIKNLEKYYSKDNIYSLNLFNKKKFINMTKVAKQYLFLIKKFVNPSGKKFLDIGANRGALVKEAKKAGFDSFGIEKNKDLVNYIKKNGLNLVELKDLENKNNFFDIVCMMHVLEHFENPKEEVRNVKRVLKKDGLFVLEVPNIESFLARHHKDSWKYIALEHIFYFSPYSLRFILEKEGFEIIYERSRNYFLDNLSIKHLLYYIFGTPINRNRFVMKNISKKKIESLNDETQQKFKFIRKMLRFILVWIIRILRREDFLFVIAKKN